jgi:hypothetical protein
MRFRFSGCLFILFLMGAIGLEAAYGQSYWVDQNGNVIPAKAAQAQPSGPGSQNNPISSAYAQRQSAPAQASIAYMQWNDPVEGAFSVLLPRGWQVTGGTQRTTRVEPHYVVRAQSPGGGVQLFMDDPRIAIRQVPNGFYAREGTAIPSAWGGKLLVERYRPAPQAAQEYVQKAVCPSATQFQGGIIPGQTEDLNRQFGAIARSEGKQIHVDVGELSFRCGEQNGYVYAITLQAWQPGGPVSLWLIYRVAGFLTRPAEGATAAAAIHRMLGSFQMNQQWLENFARECNDTAGNVIRESNAITQSTIARAKAQDAAEQAQFASWKKNSDASFNAIEKGERASTGINDGNGHDYNAQLNQKSVCNSVGDCQTVDANVTNWWFDCSGKAYPGSESGGAPSSSLSACWNKGQ